MASTGLGLGRPSADSGSKAARGRHPRESSGAYTVFDVSTPLLPPSISPTSLTGMLPLEQPQQVQVFREAFNLCDQDGDGVISRSDLEGLLASLGALPSSDRAKSQSVNPDKLASLLSTPSSTPLNFTTFVTLLASHLSPLDPEPELLTAFASFDEDESGFVRVEDLKQALASGREGLNEDEIDALLHAPFYDPKTRKFNYRLFCQTLRVTDPDDEPEQQQQHSTAP
ncbi:hypothetical protein C6P46_003360 [Rhodotorula mucilaginosa]|uniref:EF-hand domain-containing protein n=1 Tax=Rhodotorula mucilaginosa TaxID=5537 RepID=A0A9P6W214_RHOMI|nr:hypothetical protein C6P46_003360 [Rhodotorula mucilaginosa]